MTTANELDAELKALNAEIEARRPLIAKQPRKWTREQMERGEHRAAWRLRQEFEDWKTESEGYGKYLATLKRLLSFEPSTKEVFKGRISDLIPEMSVGSPNTREQLRHYVAGPSASGLQLAADGLLDEERSFRFVDYPKLFSEQRALNHPQAQLSVKPIDFSAIRIEDSQPGEHTYWLYGDEANQLEISERRGWAHRG